LLANIIQCAAGKPDSNVGVEVELGARTQEAWARKKYAYRLSSPVGEDRVGSLAVSLVEPDFNDGQDRDGYRTECSLRPSSFANVCMGAEHDVAAVETEWFEDAKTGLQTAPSWRGSAGGPSAGLPMPAGRFFDVVEARIALSFDLQRRLLVKPGITGLWQVSGRSDLSWEKGVRLDLSYVDNWSMVGTS